MERSEFRDKWVATARQSERKFFLHQHLVHGTAVCFQTLLYTQILSPSIEFDHSGFLSVPPDPNYPVTMEIRLHNNTIWWCSISISLANGECLAKMSCQVLDVWQ